MILVLIGFASQFLPWVLVPRSTFIYHYFASVPFIILGVGAAAGRMCAGAREDGVPRRVHRALRGGAGAVHRVLSAGIGHAGGALLRYAAALVQMV